MSDLIERLRHFSGDPAYGILSNARAAMVEAAARIEALEAALKADCDAQAKADLVAENERLQRDLAEERAKHALTFQHVQSDTGHRGQ